ncbi:MAG: NAD(P)H-dependent glycerol-3-phosphate dehydrogenase [bacterium]
MFDTKIAILGSGGWGTALANLLAGTGKKVALWFYEQNVFSKTLSNGTNPYLPGIKLDLHRIKLTTELILACSNKDYIILANPAQHQRAVLQEIAGHLKPSAILINAAKGIEIAGFHLMSDIIKQTLPDHYYQTACYLSGGSFADELCAHQVTAVDLASLDRDSLIKVRRLFLSSYFDLDPCQDIIGVQIGGALKNIIAIAAGILEGLNKDSYNTKAALMTKGLQEIKAFGKLRGAQAKTFSRLSGIGDLYATTNNPNSRNYKFGYNIGQGKDIKSLIDTTPNTIEGYYTTKAVYEEVFADPNQPLAHMPITAELYHILYQGKPLSKAWRDILKKSFQTKKKFRERS